MNTGNSIIFLLDEIMIFLFRLILRCRQLARERFAKMRADVLVKLELLDQKHGLFSMNILSFDCHFFLFFKYKILFFNYTDLSLLWIDITKIVMT